MAGKLANLAAIGVVVYCSSALAAAPRMTMELVVDGQRVQGTPLSYSDRNVILLGRDGNLVEFAPSEAKDFRKLADNFAPYPPSVLTGKLAAEFGPGFEINGTQHFIVVHPRGQKHQWVGRFEEMFRSFEMYFSVRDFNLTRPEFPLVAIVFANADDFHHYAAKDGARLATGTIGYYSSTSNRVALYDLGDGKSNGDLWQQNFATVLHEASHQTAFNTGIHSRWSPPPRWVAEGLGTMFEAKGVGDSRSFPNEKDRINRGRLNDFKTLRTKRKPSTVLELLKSDAMFDRDPIRAYAEAWAFTFYLVEKMPRNYAKYLQKTASRPPFSPYPSGQRVKDFTDVFGENLALLDAQFLRFIDELK
ncbi:MAG: DUF1570 domain-containing protein [Pirellulales bacterium]|nr:DUF1570 domain-containing protein [Pirellulales bacterium]